MKQIFLGLAIHNHQPLGNFPWVFEDAYQRAYLPMLEALALHPVVRVSLHYSGCLIDWLLKAHPEFFDLLKELHSSGQVEVMGGGYYEPILPSIPAADRTGQIEKLGEFIEKMFGARPSGMWLAERVWEPSLPSSLVRSEISWTLLDDTAFKMVGKKEDDLIGYFNTEDQGCVLKVFPISKYLRYSIPWHPVEDVIGYLRENSAEEGNRIMVLGDDGEKFGIWPETHRLCWEDKWVEDFFAALEKNSEWLVTIKLGDYASAYQPAGRIYLPCASYDEMLEWSLPPETSIEYTGLKRSLAEQGQQKLLRYMNSGYWRNFMARYPEINRMHKKMLMVHEKVYRARMCRKDEDCGREYLWRAQCNCPYWHGVFGGIYLTDIRAVTYGNLVNAELIADGILLQQDGSHLAREYDFDGDGNIEALMEGRDFNLYFSPAEGGSMFEWDLRRQAYNLLSTMTRRPEWYHRVLLEGSKHDDTTGGGGVRSIHDIVRIKEGEGELKPVYDRLPRSCLIDHFFNRDVTLQAFRENSYSEAGEFAGTAYQYRLEDGKIELVRQSDVQAGEGKTGIRLEKTIMLMDGQESVRVSYRFVNMGELPLDTVFGCEWNFNLLGGGHNESAYYKVEGAEIDDRRLDSSGEIAQAEHLVMGNTYLGFELELELERPLTLWRFPVESLSNSEGGIERVYQANCLVILLPLRLDRNGEFRFKFTWHVKEIGA